MEHPVWKWADRIFPLDSFVENIVAMAKFHCALHFNLGGWGGNGFRKCTIQAGEVGDLLKRGAPISLLRWSFISP